jgi:hypothetical protein
MRINIRMADHSELMKTHSNSNFIKATDVHFFSRQSIYLTFLYGLKRFIVEIF